MPCCAGVTVAVSQICTLRSKLKDSRSSVEQLATELSSLKISMHEREAEWSTALRSSMERPLSMLGGCSAALDCMLPLTTALAS